MYLANNRFVFTILLHFLKYLYYDKPCLRVNINLHVYLSQKYYIGIYSKEYREGTEDGKGDYQESRLNLKQLLRYTI